MVKKAFIILFFFIILIPSASAAPESRSNLPSLPSQEQQSSQQIAIFMTPNKMTEQELKRMGRKYPDIEIRHYFQHALNGFSAKGLTKSLRKVSKGFPHDEAFSCKPI